MASLFDPSRSRSELRATYKRLRAQLGAALEARVVVNITVTSRRIKRDRPADDDYDDRPDSEQLFPDY